MVICLMFAAQHIAPIHFCRKSLFIRLPQTKLYQQVLSVPI